MLLYVEGEAPTARRLAKAAARHSLGAGYSLAWLALSISPGLRKLAQARTPATPLAEDRSEVVASVEVTGSVGEAFG
jgi:predicted metal-binding membrane protein